MPPRFFVWVIFLFWLVMAGWLFDRAVLPQFLPHRQPTFFRFQHADEVRHAATRWYVYRDHRKIGAPRDEDKLQIASGDSDLQRKNRGFKFSCDLNFKNWVLFDARRMALFRVPVQKIKLKEIVSTFWVNLKGELQSMSSEVTLLVDDKELPVTALMTGEVKEGMFTSKLSIRGFHGLLRKPLTLDPVPVTPGESFINPLHPLNKIWDLEDGQHWRMPVADPMADAVRAMLAKLPIVDMLLPRQVQYLDAQVSSEVLQVGGRRHACWVIDYRQPGKNQVMARTWVQRSDNRVLRQEAVFENSRLVMDRMR